MEIGDIGGFDPPTGWAAASGQRLCVPIGIDARGDPVRLGQVLINLVGNAIKFTKEGEIVVEVHPAREQPDDKDDVLLEFAVVDTGAGIPKDRLANIFDSFTQADASTTRR